jgi:hypothetical protein
MANTPNTVEDFWALVKTTEAGCWEWQGALWATGYGRFHYANKSYKAHRLAWVFTGGELDDETCLLHRCDNRRCVNPAHLFKGDRADNNRDKTVKGRQTKGAAVNTAKLNESLVEAIRKHPGNSKDIAALFGVTWGHVNKIKRGGVWRG